jgi:putative addiction module component (TIGR02574 family)
MRRRDSFSAKSGSNLKTSPQGKPETKVGSSGLLPVAASMGKVIWNGCIPIPERMSMLFDSVILLDRSVHSDDDLPMSLASIQKEIFQLNSRERAMLIDLLWESLDEARISEIETKWAAESEDRIDAYERGELPAVDGPAALQDLRSSLRK